jgi:hypothetical protein
MIVVFVAYKIPLERLAAHFAWNDESYRAVHADVLAVVDSGTFLQLGMQSCHLLPIYARAYAYPAPLEIFSLARTANYGIRLAAADGGAVVKTDVDCWFAPGLLARLGAVKAGKGMIPRYHMAENIADARAGRARVWQASRGTVALDAADWRRLCGYNENMAGYGVEDGDLEDRAAAAGVKFEYPPGLFHIAHAAGRGGQRVYWNRENGNPANHAENRKLRGKPWQNAEWGIARC